jgi:hypothetical protein
LAALEKFKGEQFEERTEDQRHKIMGDVAQVNDMDFPCCVSIPENLRHETARLVPPIQLGRTILRRAVRGDDARKHRIVEAALYTGDEWGNIAVAERITLHDAAPVRF